VDVEKLGHAVPYLSRHGAAVSRNQFPIVPDWHHPFG
jgi:hypothetical protein